MTHIWESPEQIAAEKSAREAKAKANRMAAFRKRRDAKLAECDWTQLPDAPITVEQRAAWAAYRQALRDVPSTATEDGWVTWPSRPT